MLLLGKVVVACRIARILKRYEQRENPATARRWLSLFLKKNCSQIFWCTSLNVHEVFVQLQQQYFDDAAVTEQVETWSHAGQYTIQLVKQGPRTRSVLKHTQAKLPWHNFLHRLNEFLSTARSH